MNKIPSYPKIFNLGNNAIENLFEGEVEITEKVDGSQFRFGIDCNDQLMFGSKGVQLYTKEQNGMFSLAVEQIEKRYDILKTLRAESANRTGNPDIELFFYGEYLNKPKHNVLKYGRVPTDNIILFSVRVGENFVDKHGHLLAYGATLGLEVVPVLFRGVLENGSTTRYEKLKDIISNTKSVLGEEIIEGVVIKNYSEFHFLTGNPTPCFGKYVREDFKEKLHKEWPGISGKNSLQEFIDGYKTEARWVKAIQHLRDNGELENSPRDIGKLLKEIHVDIVAEDKEVIKDWLYNYFIKDIKRRAIAGFPEFYKDLLLKKQCEVDNEVEG